MAEKAVQIIKNLLKKAHLDKQNPYLALALLEYRNTPMSDNLGSPTQQLMGTEQKYCFQHLTIQDNPFQNSDKGVVLQEGKTEALL